MMISIVTACRNMRGHIPETVDSVLAQGHSTLEYIVVDGDSSDGSREWLEQRASKFSRFVSEPDAGQYHAIAKGLSWATGDVMGWLNADDILLPWALKTIERVFTSFPEVDWIIGLPMYLDANSECFLVSPVAASYTRRFIQNGWYREGVLGFLMQESMFWRRSLYEKVGGLNLGLNLAADFELWTRFAEHAELTAVAAPLSAFRIRGTENRSRQGRSYLNEVEGCSAHRPRPPFWWRRLCARGKIGEAVLRLLLRSTTPIVARSLTGDRWQLLRTRRTISRNDLSRLFLERELRKRDDRDRVSVA